MFRNTLILLSILLSCSLSSWVMAEQVLPEGCVSANYSFEEGLLILDDDDNIGHKQHLFAIGNTGKKSVTLDHPSGVAAAKAGWMMVLKPKKWAALSVESDDFELVCKQGRRFVDCDKVLTVCEFTQAVFSLEQTGSYWVSENLPKDDIIASIEHRDISL